MYIKTKVIKMGIFFVLLMLFGLTLYLFTRETSISPNKTSSAIKKKDIIANDTKYEAQEIFFPKSSGISFSSMDWYSDRLMKMQEPSLFSLSTTEEGLESYRFLWLRSFHEHTLFRFSKLENQYILSVKQLNEKDKVILNQTLILSVKEWDDFTNCLKQSYFWELSTLEKTDVPLVSGDGSLWVIESVKHNKYHIVERHSPKGNLQECGFILIKLSQLKIEKDEMY